LFEGVVERGTVSNHEEYLFISDVLCMPSYREGFGSVVIDAAALGVPCIGSRIVGLVDSIADGFTGLLHPPGDINGLVECLHQLDSDKILLSELGASAKIRVTTYFSSEIMCQLLIDFYCDQ
jgi:glycosyltransferase involved in cell wall biosynthesis